MRSGKGSLRLLSTLPSGVTVHTTSILLFDTQTTTGGLPSTQQLRVMILIWSNIRGLRKPRLNSPARAVKDNSTHTTFQGRISFGLCHILRALALWILDWCIHEVIIHVYTSLPLSISSFLPAKQGIWPGSNYSRADITLRSISCTHWIWGVYCGLTAAHHACAALFVSVLGWDSPADWPPLFGSVWDAYSLHRFWGVFWHRLHAARGPPRRRFGDIPGTEGASGAVGLHALGGLPRAGVVLYRRACVLSELRFFLSNWAVCFLETVCGWDGGKDAAKPSGSCPASWSRKIVGKYRLCLGLLLLHGSCLAISCHFSQSVRLLVCQISKLFVCTAFFLADVPSSMSLALRTPRRFRGPCL